MPAQKGPVVPDGLTYVVGADLAEGGELVVDDHVCGGVKD